MRQKPAQKPDALEEEALRELRKAADNLWSAAGSLKEAGYFGPGIKERLEGIQETAKAVKRHTGERMRLIF